jgi:hypothetical protein
MISHASSQVEKWRYAIKESHATRFATSAPIGQLATNLVVDRFAFVRSSQRVGSCNSLIV